MATQIIFQRVTLSNNYEIFLVIIYCIFMLSHFSRVQLSETLWTVARQAPLSMEFSRQEYWSGLPFPPPSIFLTQGWNLSLLPISARSWDQVGTNTHLFYPHPYPHTQEGLARNMLSKRTVFREFLGGPVAKILSFQCRAPGFAPRSGN